LLKSFGKAFLLFKPKRTCERTQEGFKD